MAGSRYIAVFDNADNDCGVFVLLERNACVRVNVIQAMARSALRLACLVLLLGHFRTPLLWRAARQSLR